MPKGSMLGAIIGNCYRVLCLLASPISVVEIERELGLKGNGNGLNYILAIQKYCPELRDRLRSGKRNTRGRRATVYWIDYLGDNKENLKTGESYD